MNLELTDFYKHLNEAVVTTDDFEEGTKFRKREKVSQFAYCGLNPMYRHYLSFDLDDSGSAFRYEAVGLPPPTIITINRKNAHCHYLYKLKTPVAYHANSRAKPQQFFEAIQDAMTKCLKADTAFTHTLTKNPLHPRWEVITNPASYHLSDFLEYIDLPKHSAIKPLPDDMNVRGRNDQLFHTLRLWGYHAVQSYISEESWLQEAQSQATAINDSFTCPLPCKEVHDTAKASAKWIWKNRHNFSIRQKVLSFTNESAHERMSKGADYTNAIRTKKTIQAIQDTVNEMLASGHTITPMSVQIRSGLNIKTIRKYLPKINLQPVKH